MKAQNAIVTAKEASQFVGQNISICDSVYNINILEGATYVSLGGNYPNAPLTLVILKEDRQKFSFNPTAYNNKRICARGGISKGNGSLQIVVKSPEQIITEQKYREINRIDESGNMYEPINAVIADADDPVSNPETPPQYIGGMEAWLDYLTKNLKYPTKAKELGIKGRVQVLFIVEKDGSLSDIKVIRGLEPGCNEEALRLVKTGTKFKPAMHRGEVVRAYHSVLVRFE